MKETRVAESLILSILRQIESGVPLSGSARAHGLSSATFCEWREVLKVIRVDNGSRIRQRHADGMGRGLRHRYDPHPAGQWEGPRVAVQG